MSDFSMNKAIIQGIVGRDIELRYSSSGMAMADFSVATESKRKDKNGELVKKTEWHSCKVFDKKAEFIAKNAGKGFVVNLEGEIHSREYPNKNDVIVKVKEIIVDKIKIICNLNEKKDALAPAPTPAPTETKKAETGRTITTANGDFTLPAKEEEDDDLPF